MPNIVIATDFSEVAENAAHFGCRLAQDFGADVTVIHSFMIPITFNDNPMPVMPVDEGKDLAETRMKDFAGRLRGSYPGVAIDDHIMYGSIIDCLEEYAEENRFWLAVLGNSGEGSSSLWMGSNVVSALKDIDQNVLAVPAGYEYKKPEKICFACDYKDVADHYQLSRLAELVEVTGAQLHIVNVDHGNKNFSPDTMYESKELHHELTAANPVYHYVEHEHVDQAISEFVEANHMDWLVIAPHKHSFFGSLFHKSHTKAMVKMSHVPLMALHEKD